MDPEVVIIGADGTEHVFPPGFDPKQAAAIVRGGAKPTQPERSEARIQATERTGDYVAQTLRNVPQDAWGQIKGVGSLLGTLAGATGELGSDIGNTVRATVGLTPHWQSDRPNQAALKAMPGVIAQHYAGYLDPNTLAEQVREHPVGTALDITGALKGGSAAGSQVRNAAAKVPGIVAKGGPLVGVALDHTPILGKLRSISRAIEQMAPEDVAPVPSHAVTPEPLATMHATLDAAKAQPVPMPTRSVPEPAPQAAPSSMVEELLKREIDWRTTDAVPIDAIARDISRGGTILEAGESQIGIGERLAAAMKGAAKGDAKAAAEAELLARALRQRMHIAQRPRPMASH